MLSKHALKRWGPQGTQGLHLSQGLVQWCGVVATYGVWIHTRGVAHSGCFKRKDVGPTDQPKTKGYFKLRVVLHGGITANRSKPLGLCGTLLADKLNFCLANAWSSGNVRKTFGMFIPWHNLSTFCCVMMHFKVDLMPSISWYPLNRWHHDKAPNLRWQHSPAGSWQCTESLAALSCEQWPSLGRLGLIWSLRWKIKLQWALSMDVGMFIRCLWYWKHVVFDPGCPGRETLSLWQGRGCCVFVIKHLLCCTGFKGRALCDILGNRCPWQKIVQAILKVNNAKFSRVSTTLWWFPRKSNIQENIYLYVCLSTVSIKKTFGFSSGHKPWAFGSLFAWGALPEVGCLQHRDSAAGHGAIRPGPLHQADLRQHRHHLPGPQG